MSASKYIVVNGQVYKQATMTDVWHMWSQTVNTSAKSAQTKLAKLRQVLTSLIPVAHPEHFDVDKLVTDTMALVNAVVETSRDLVIGLEKPNA